MIPPAGSRDGRRATADGAARRRIAFLAWRDVSHPEGGGSELFVQRVAEYLAQHGWDVTICAAAHGNAPDDELRGGVRMRRRGGRLTVYLRGLAYLWTKAGRGTDVVVDVQNGVPFFSPLARRRGIVNLVHHVHQEQWQIIYPGTAGRIGWWLESRLAPWLYRHHQYVTVSEATRRDLVALGIERGRISIVHNGIDMPHPARLRDRADAPTVCALGRLVPHKQVEHALVVLAHLRSTMPDCRLEIIGDGWWRERLCDLTRELDIEDAVRFHGVVTDLERAAILDEAWVLLAPSVKEGWGIAIMDAAARGVPAIAYRSAGGVCESIVDGGTGWVVDDLDELEKRTEELLRDAALRQRMGSDARSRAATFTWHDTGLHFAQTVERLFAGPRPDDRLAGSRR